MEDTPWVENIAFALRRLNYAKSGLQTWTNSPDPRQLLSDTNGKSKSGRLSRSHYLIKHVQYLTSNFLKLWARSLLLSYQWQSVVSVIIAINFAINLAQSYAMPENGSGTAEFFFCLDVIFTVVWSLLTFGPLMLVSIMYPSEWRQVFTVELVLNLFGSWFWPFFRDGWCEHF